jgi:hypothetical protein
MCDCSTIDICCYLQVQQDDNTKIVVFKTCLINKKDKFKIGGQVVQ